MNQPTYLAHRSRRVYEYTMVKRFEERLEKQKKRQRLNTILMILGFSVLAVLTVVLAVMSRNLVRFLML